MFLHWAWDPAEIQKTLPRGLFVDTFDDQAWLGIVPFFMRKVHPRGLPCLPWLSDFLELNVRTYVYQQRRAARYLVLFTDVQSGPCGGARQALLPFELRSRAHACSRRSKRNLYLPRETTSNARGTVSLSRAHQVRRQKHNRVRSSSFWSNVTFFTLRIAEPRLLWASSSSALPYRSRLVETWSFNPAAADGFSTPERGPDHVLAAEDLQVEAWPIIADRISSPASGRHREATS